MTTIRVDGHDTGTPQQVAPQQVYSVPLNATSAINIKLFEEQQQQYPYRQGMPMTPSASTYICTNKECTKQYTPDKYSVVINTDDGAVNNMDVYPINIANYSTPHVYATLPQQQIQHTQMHRQQTQQSPQQQRRVQYDRLHQSPAEQDSSLRQQQQQQQPRHQPSDAQPMPLEQSDVHQVQLHGPPERLNTAVNTDHSTASVIDDSANEMTSHVPHNAVTTLSYDSSINTIHASPGQEPRNVLLSVESEPDSARDSMPDDAVSMNSSGSLGASGSLNEGMTSLNLNSSSDDVIVTHSGQRDFIYGRCQSLSDSVDSQFSNYGSMASPTSPTAPKEKKQVKFDKMLPLTWDEDEDEGSEHSLDAKLMDGSAFILDDFTEEETRTVEDAEGLKGTRVALYRGQVLTAMLKVKCSSEEMGFDLRVLSLMQDMLVRCDQLGHKMKGSAVRLTPFHLNKMKLQDGRPSKERAAEVARVLGGDLILCEAVCQKHAERIHIATEIKQQVYEKGSFVVGKVGILVTLWKKHKYSVAAEFSSPLADHIHFYRPHLLGNTSESALKRKRKGTDTVRKVFQSRDLLSQMFKADPTITVAEAARRSFVEVLFYALYE